MTDVLRPYQAQVVAEFWRQVEAGQHRILLVAPTAAGKTVIARAIVEQARSQNCGSLFLAHRREIITRTRNKLRGIPHGVIRPGERPRPLEPVQVASVQTLHRRAIKTATMALPEADIVIVDECHHVIAQSYRSIIEQYPTAILLGLTATPCRGDGRGLGSVFQTLIQCPQVGELVEQGFLVPTRVYAAVDRTAFTSGTAITLRANSPIVWTGRNWSAISSATGSSTVSGARPSALRPASGTRSTSATNSFRAASAPSTSTAPRRWMSATPRWRSSLPARSRW